MRRGKNRTVTNAATGSSRHRATPDSRKRNASKPQRQPGSTQGISVPGARRIWGALKSTTTRAVEKVITSLTTVGGSELKIKRKYKTATDSSTRVVRWWFVVRAEEFVLEQLQKEWNQVALQTDWKLTPLLQYAKSSLHNSEAQLHQQPGPSWDIAIESTTNLGPDPMKPAELDSDAQQSPSNMQQLTPNEQTNTPVVHQSSQSSL